MKKMKRYAAAAGAFAALSLALSGCSGGGSSSADGDVTVTFLTHWGDDQVAALEKAADAFTADNPTIHIEVQAVPFANLLSTLRTQGTSDSGPTIAGIYDAWLPELVRDGFAAAAPDDVASDVTSNYPESASEPATESGSVYGIPNEIDLYQLNYNKAIFEKAGITDAPTTWDEVIADAQKIKDTGAAEQGIGFITSWASGAVHPFLSLLASNGGTFLNSDGTASNLDSSEALETAEFYQTLRDEGLTDSSMSTANASTTGPYLDNFVNGKTGMIIMANWWESSLQDAMGDSFSDVATAPIPVGPSGSTSSSVSYTWMTMVNANSTTAQQDAAWKFLSWLNGSTSGENGSSAMGDILMSMGIIPSRTSDQEAYSDVLQSDFMASYVQALDTATPYPTVVGGAAAADALEKDVESLLFGQSDAQAAMDQAKKDVDSALSSAQ